MKRTIGYFSFTGEEERKSKEALYEQVELGKLYAGNGEDSFFEFLNTVLNDEDTLVISSFADLGNQFMQLLHALDYIKHSNIDVVVQAWSCWQWFCSPSVCLLKASHWSQVSTVSSIWAVPC